MTNVEKLNKSLKLKFLDLLCKVSGHLCVWSNEKRIHLSALAQHKDRKSEFEN